MSDSVISPHSLTVRRSSKTPVTSNIFQRLVAEIHHDLGRGRRVAESRELRDSINGKLHEVYIVADAVVAGYPLIISIKVRDRARPADITR